MHSRRLSLAVVSTWVLAGLTTSARAYVDLAPTLGKIVNDSKSIALVEVSGFDPATQTVTLKPIRTLKGDTVADAITNRVAPANGLAPPVIRQWAAPGTRAVWFATKTTALVCMGTGWYQVKHADAGWRLGVDRPDLPLAYCGTPTRLSDAVTKMVAGETTLITAVVYGATDVDTSFDLALGRTNLPGQAKVQRLKAGLAMPQMVAATAEADVVVGTGPVEIGDLPGLIQSLDSKDPTARAEAAESIGYLNAAAAPAKATLTRTLVDSDAVVRTSAASTLLRISADDQEAKQTISTALADATAATRRAGATSVAYAGAAAAPLALELIKLLGDSDESVRAAGLQAVTTLGPSFSPADAKAAAELLVPMLSGKLWRVDAADALGRLGRAVRPAPAALATMIGDTQPAVRWAAVRALAQIGGTEAKPAVAFMKAQLPTGSEVEQYNMMIYLALIGPDAADAASVIRSTRIKNPVLPGATLWAIGDTTQLPWQMPNTRGGPGGMGGGGLGGGGPMDINRYMYAAYVRELGDRLKPAAVSLANHLLHGTAGDVPEWGYGLLAADTPGVLAILTPKLEDYDRTVRQRAAVTLGFMGPDAKAALPAVEAAVKHATDEREKRMITWCAKKLGA